MYFTRVVLDKQYFDYCIFMLKQMLKHWVFCYVKTIHIKIDWLIIADKHSGCKFVIRSEQLILSSDLLKQMCRHCPYVQGHSENLKTLGHT